MAGNPINVYVAYAREDEKLLTELGNHLSSLKRNGDIANWDDRYIEAGEETAPLMQHNLANAQIILLLVSADFLASDELWRTAVDQAIARHHPGIARVIPIILRPCDWQNAPFGKLTPLPKAGGKAHGGSASSLLRPIYPTRRLARGLQPDRNHRHCPHL